MVRPSRRVSCNGRRTRSSVRTPSSAGGSKTSPNFSDNGLGVGSGRRRRPGHSGAAAQLWRARPRAKSARDFWGFDIYTAYRQCAGAARRTAGAAVDRQRRQHGRRRGSAACARRRSCERDHARAGVRPGLRLHRRQWSAARRRHAGRDGRRAHARAAAAARRASRYPCGCGRDWGCVEVYTTLSGLPHLLDERLPKYPNHELASSPLGRKERALALRGLAQKGDPLATEIFDFQAQDAGHPRRHAGRWRSIPSS